MNDLDQAALQRRSDELDAQQRFLDVQREKLEKGPLKLKVLDAQIQGKTEQLQDLQAEIAKLQTKFDNSRAGLDHELSHQLAELKKSKVELDSKVIEAQETLTTINQSISTANADLKKINKDIQDRESYFKTQEATIAQTLEAGNEHLTNLKNAGEGLETDITYLKGNLAKLQDEVNTSIIRRGDIEDEIEELTIEYAKKSQHYNNEIATLTKKLAAIDVDIKVRLDAIEERERNLEIRETSIRTKVDALALDKQELQQEKRRFEASKYEL